METAQRTHPLVITAAVSVTALSMAGIAAIFGLIPGGPLKPVADPLPIAHSVAALAAPLPAATTLPARSEAPTTVSIPAGSSVRIETPGERPAARTVRVTTTRTASARDPSAVERTAPAPAPANMVRVADDAPIYAEPSSRNRRDDGFRNTEAQPAVAPPTCRECGSIAAIREVRREGEANGLGAVAGGVLGGLVGHQVGGGRGRDAMAVVGVLGGAYAGHQIEKSQRTTNEYEITVRHDDGTSRVIRQSAAPGWHEGDRVRVSGGQIVAL